MKLSDINPGDPYLVRATHPALGGGKARATRRVTVISAERQGVVVEYLAPVCVNLDDIPPGGFARAMLDGELRYEHRPVRRTVAARDILHPAPPAPSGQPGLDETEPAGQEVVA